MLITIDGPAALGAQPRFPFVPVTTLTATVFKHSGSLFGMFSRHLDFEASAHVGVQPMPHVEVFVFNVARDAVLRQNDSGNVGLADKPRGLNAHEQGTGSGEQQVNLRRANSDGKLADFPCQERLDNNL